MTHGSKWTPEEVQRAIVMSEFSTAKDIGEALDRTTAAIVQKFASMKVPLIRSLKSETLNRGPKRNLQRKVEAQRTRKRQTVKALAEHATSIDPDTDDLIVAKDAAEQLGMSKREILRLFADHKIECIVHHGVVCTTQDAIDSYVSQQ